MDRTDDAAGTLAREAAGAEWRSAAACAGDELFLAGLAVPEAPDGGAWSGSGIPGESAPAGSATAPLGELEAIAQQHVPSSSAYPWSAVVRVVSLFPNGATAEGSGAIVGRNDVLTAAHVVYQPAWGGYASSVLVVPASDPSLVFNGPYGSSPASITVADAGYADVGGGRSIPPGNGGPGLVGSERDVAFLTLQWPLGDRTGWMGLDPTFKEGYANLSGYPVWAGGNLTNDVAFARADAVDAYINMYWFEARPGNSGGPLWHYGPDGNPAVVGLASSAYTNGRGGAAFEVATSYESILGWIKANDYLLA